MGTATNPVTVSGQFKVDPMRLQALGVLDATLAIDTRLFIDPLLIAKSSHPELNGAGVKQYRDRFATVIKLLAASDAENDPPWKAAYRLFCFPEIPGTCLGYGAGSIHGSGWGPELRTRTLKVASKIIKVGVHDPDLFAAMALFEPGIGPDRLSDMAATIAMGAFASFNARVLKHLGLRGESFVLDGQTYNFLRNPLEHKRTPIILVPTDVLRELPVALDWEGVKAAAIHNSELRARANQHVAAIWKKKTKQEKAALKSQALGSREAFMTVLDSIHAASDKPYDVLSDPQNLIRWAQLGKQYAENNPIANRSVVTVQNVDDVMSIVREIVAQFQHLVENSGLNKELYADGVPRHESSSQRLFFAAAYAYCKAYNVDISPEIDTGNGKIDFKLSRGFDERVLVEIKLSTNSSTVAGYTKQLDVYKSAQQTTRAIYLVINVGRMGKKEEDLIAAKNRRAKAGGPVSDLAFVDGRIKPTASKRK